MKKLLLILSIFVVSLSAFAADLNPFAYELRSSVNALNPMQLDIEYKLNAPATSVKVYLYDVDKTWEQEVTVQELLSKKLDDHRTAYSYTGWIDLSVIPGHLRGGENNILWRVDVTGKAVTNELDFVRNDVKFYAPTSIDVDNNPENSNFGTVFCVEGADNAYGDDAYKTYTSYTDGAGLYVLDADGSPRRIPFLNVERYGYNGGVLGNHPRTRNFFDHDGNKKYPAFQTYRVRVADDGRIFITSLNTDGQVLWEADTISFCASTKDEWKTGWKKVMAAGVEGAVKATSKRNCEHPYCGIYSLFAGNASTGDFIAGPNIGFDVRGGGDDLQLLMLSGCQQAIAAMTPKHFYCSEYNLGQKTTWGQKPNWYVFKDHVLYYTDPQVEYDKDGNIWFCQYRGVQDDYPTLVRYNRTTKEIDSEDKVNKFTAHLRTGAIRFNKDFTKLAIATKGTGSGGAVTIYPVKEDGWPDFNNGKEVSTRDKTSYTLTDFAWDYADNLYIASKNKEGSAGECIAVYATKRSADEVVSTPAASWRAFGVDCASEESYTIDVIADDNQGSATITAGFDAEGKVPACTPVEVFAQSNDDYKFVCWKEGDNTVSTDNPYTFSAVKDATLTAHFEAGNYTVTWWNLLNNKNDLDKSGDLDNLEELWNLITVYFNDYNVKNNNATDSKIRSRTQIANGLSAIQTFFATGYVDGYIEGFLTNSTGKNYLTFTWLGDYINTVKSKTTSSTGWYYWLSHFFAGYKEWYLYNNPSQWLPYYCNGVCGLPMQITYNTPLPVEIKEISPSKSEITNLTVLSRTSYPSWYVRYYQADKLLAWRDGGTTGRIVHHVYRDNMKLYATYVDKALQEDDPTPDLSKNPYDATNNDVLDLLANDNHGSTPHNVTVDRKFAGGMYNTVCFPFDLPITSLPVELRDADILAFTGVTKTGDEFGDPVAILNFIPLADYWQLRNDPPDVPYMEAGVPYLIKPKNDVNNASLTYTNLLQWRFYNSSRTPNQERVGGVTFQGVFNPTTITEENAYILVADNRLAKVTGNNREIKGYRGYFIINDAALRNMAAEGRVYFSFKKPVTTSIPVAPEAEQQAQPKVRKVMYDGQIYILRGEEVYTITGHRVK